MKLNRFLSLLLVMFVLLTALPASAEEMPYAISVDLTNQIVTIYSTEDGSIVRQMLCSTAKPGCTTPEGVFEMTPIRRKTERHKWYYIAYYRDYVQWSSRITGNILFHSLPYTDDDEATLQIEEAKQFGFPASHGCIRLLNDDSKFIAQFCLPGTMVNIFRSEEPQPELRELLFEGSYTLDSGLTYEQFLGTPDDPDTLGRFCTGQDVEDLQYRLRALGFYNGEISGTYGASTVNAVRQLQKAINVEQSGQVTPALSTLIYSADAPTGTSVTITEGMSGPIVRILQENLAALRLYEGEIDGIYDVDVVAAARIFQQLYGYTADGIVTPEAQQAIFYEVENLSSLFGSANYACEKLVETVNMATISANDKVRIREDATTYSDELGKIAVGEQVTVLAPGDSWSKIQYGGTVGYVYNKFLVSTPIETYTLLYSVPGNATTHTIGNTLEQYSNGAQLPAAIFAQRRAAEAAAGTPDVETYATVITGSDNTKLNLRAEPDSSSEILAELENGAEVRVLNKGDEWTFAECDAGHGYLMNDYLEYRTVVVEDEQPIEYDEEDLSEQSIDATVDAPTGYAVIYNSGSDDADEIGALPHSAEITLLAIDDGWCLIDHNGRRGYMLEENVQYNPDDIVI